MILLLLLWAATLAPAADFVSLSKHGNIFSFKTTEGTAELEWVSNSSFRFAHLWTRGVSSRPITKETIPVIHSDRGPDLLFDGGNLMVTIEKSGFRLRVREADGKLLLFDETGVSKGPSAITVERRAIPYEQYFGLGARTDSTFDARGSVIVAGKPFLNSSLGYGLYFPRAGEYTLDLAKSHPERYRITLRGGQRFEFFFYLGATPKAVLEEHLKVTGALGWEVPDFDLHPPSKLPGYAYRLPRELNLCDSVAAVSHASLSAVLAPAFDLDAHRGERADQLAAVIPILYGVPRRPASPLRKTLMPFHVTYLQEARDRGYPILRAIPFQYPGDVEALKHPDEFLFGDELLVAPICGDSGRREVYLPRGVWTNLRTGQAYPGRQVIQIEAATDELPLFGRNGSILPWAPEDGKGPMRLDYFPKLAAEFFIWEPEFDHISQVHAAPAADIYRFEIESLKDRVYEWAFHHTDRPARVYQLPGRSLQEAASKTELKPGSWFYDAKLRRLYFQVAAIAGGDETVNVKY